MFDFLSGRGLPCRTGSPCSTSRMNAGGRTVFALSYPEAWLTARESLLYVSLFRSENKSPQTEEDARPHQRFYNAPSSPLASRLSPSTASSLPLAHSVVWKHSSLALIISHYLGLPPTASLIFFTPFFPKLCVCGL